jgi:hypothetical protein
MTKPVRALSASDVVNFCALCDKAHEYWLNHLGLFHNNPRDTELMKSIARPEWVRFSIISQEYSLLQLVKLHDKAVMNGNFNLGIKYVLAYGGWSGPLRSSLEKLENELDRFADQLLDARNKILSHNDFTTISAGADLGAFADGEDEKYFKALQKFVNLVHGEVIGCPYPFNNLVKNDIAFFLRTIKP